jgi:anti-anti-sigma regulatory factor
MIWSVWTTGRGCSAYEEQATDPADQFSQSNLLRVSVHWASTVATMTLGGEVDISSVHLLTDPFKKVLEKGELSALIIDLGLVTFLDSSGLVGATPQVQRLFDLTGLRSILTISPE